MNTAEQLLNAGEYLNRGIGEVPITERMKRVADFFKVSILDEQAIRDIITETEKIFIADFAKNGRWKEEFHSPSNFFYELYKLLRDEDMYLETVVGHNIIRDTLDKVLAVMAEHLQEECIKHHIVEDYARDVLTIALWIHAKVSRNHQGKANTLLRLCGEHLDKVKVLVMINCEAKKLDFIGSDFTYDGLEAGQNLLAAGLAIQLGAKKTLNQALKSKVAENSVENPAQEVVEHLQNEIRHECRYTDAHDTDMDVVKKDLRTLSKCPGWDTSKVETWFENEFPYKVTKPV